MEPNFGWPTHHHQELYLFYIFSQAECLFVYARPESLVDAKLLLGCDDLQMTSVYANDWIFSALVARVLAVMTAWECGVDTGHRPEECIVTRLGPGCLVTPGTAQTGYRSLSLGTCGQKRIYYQLK